MTLTLFLASSFAVSGEEENNKSISFSQCRDIAQEYGFNTPKQLKEKLTGYSIGDPLSDKEFQDANIQFFTAIKKLPKEFVRSCKLKTVILVKNLKISKSKKTSDENNQISSSGYVQGDTLHLSYPFHEKTIYQALFMIFDKKDNIKKWNKLNNPKFVYAGNKFAEMYGDKADGKNKKTISKEDIINDFVNEHAMTYEWMDRADTFAYMLTYPTEVWEKAKKSEVLYKKLLYIVEETESNHFLGKDFWGKIYPELQKDKNNKNTTKDSNNSSPKQDKNTKKSEK